MIEPRHAVRHGGDILFQPLGVAPVEIYAAQKMVFYGLLLGLALIGGGVAVYFIGNTSTDLRDVYKHNVTVWGAFAVGGAFALAAFVKLFIQPCVVVVSAEGVRIRDGLFWKRAGWGTFDVIEVHRSPTRIRVRLAKQDYWNPLVIGGHYPIPEVLRALEKFKPQSMPVRDITHRDRKTMPSSFWDDMV